MYFKKSLTHRLRGKISILFTSHPTSLWSVWLVRVSRSLETSLRVILPRVFPPHVFLPGVFLPRAAVAFRRQPFCYALLVFGLACSGLLGCQKFTESKDSPTGNVVQLMLGKSKLLCLEKFPHEMALYLSDELSSQRLNEMTDCVQGALELFSQWTQGAAPDRYLGSELQYFLNKYLLQEHQISDSMMIELMKLKVLLFGGSSESLTRTEIKRLRTFLERLRDQSQRLRGSWKTLLLSDPKAQFSFSELEDLKKKVMKEVFEFFEGTEIASSQYGWIDFEKFILEFDQFLGGKAELKVLQKWFPLLKQLKITFLGENRNLTLGDLWREQLEWAGEAYFLSLKYYYHLRLDSFFSDRYFRDWARFGEEFFDLLERSPQMKDRNSIQVEPLMRSLDRAFELGVARSPVGLETLKKSLHTAVWSLLSGRLQSDPSLVLQYDREQLSVLRHEFRTWVLPGLWRQALASGALTSSRSGSLWEDWIVQAKEVKWRHIKFLIDSVRGKENYWNEFDQSLIWQGWEDWVRILEDSRLPVWSQGVLHILPDKSHLDSSFADWQKVAAARTYTRLIQRGYGSPKTLDLWKQRVSKDSFLAFERHFRDLGRALGFLDPRSTDSAERTFFEANHFPRSAVPDAELSSSELFEIYSLLAGGGRETALRIIESYKNNPGCLMGTDDIFEKPILRRSCFYQDLDVLFSAWFQGLSSWVVLSRTWTDPDWNQFKELLGLLTPRKFYNQGENLEYAELRLLTTLIHYIENLMMEFDSNHDGHISSAEMDRGALRFRDILEPLAGENYKSVFNIILEEGKTPTGWDVFWHKVKSILPRRDSKKLGRLEIMRAMVVVIQAQSAGKNQSPAK